MQDLYDDLRIVTLVDGINSKNSSKNNSVVDDAFTDLEIVDKIGLINISTFDRITEQSAEVAANSSSNYLSAMNDFVSNSAPRSNDFEQPNLLPIQKSNDELSSSLHYVQKNNEELISKMKVLELKLENTRGKLTRTYEVNEALEDELRAARRRIAELEAETAPPQTIDTDDNYSHSDDDGSAALTKSSCMHPHKARASTELQKFSHKLVAARQTSSLLETKVSGYTTV